MICVSTPATHVSYVLYMSCYNYIEKKNMSPTIGKNPPKTDSRELLGCPL